MTWTRDAAKRALDVLLAALGLVLLAPLLAYIALRIKLDTPGPAFFRRGDFPPAAACHGFGVVSAFSAATRLGWAGRLIDNALYGVDRLLMPLMDQTSCPCAVYLHVYRNPS